MALQYAGTDIDWNGYCIPDYLYGLYITDQYESFHWSNYEFIGLSNYSRALLKADSGFLGALVAGFAAGYIILGLRKACEKLPEALEKIAPVLIYPVVGILAMGLLMLFIVEPIMGTVNTVLNNGLASMGGSSKLILGMILGGMMAIDMGRPVTTKQLTYSEQQPSQQETTTLWHPL